MENLTTELERICRYIAGPLLGITCAAQPQPGKSPEPHAVDASERIHLRRHLSSGN